MPIPTAEIQYLIVNASQNTDQQEKVLAAVGLYQSESADTIVQSAEIAEVENDVVSIKLSRVVLSATSYEQMQEIADRMHRGVEKHFSDEDREILSKRFVGITLTGELGSVN